MHLDHISYVASHEQLADTVQRLGSRLGCTFVDGGIHPRFGTRNFTTSLKNGRYLEVVCPLDHPATEQTPWGKAVSKKANEGGGWLTWVFSTSDISPIEAKFGRAAIEGHRTKPSGSDLKWKQIGVNDIFETPQYPFFIQWLSSEHPSQEGVASSDIQRIVIADSNKLAGSWFREEILESLGDTTIEWLESVGEDAQSGIAEVHISTPNGLVVLD